MTNGEQLLDLAKRKYTFKAKDYLKSGFEMWRRHAFRYCLHVLVYMVIVEILLFLIKNFDFFQDLFEILYPYFGNAVTTLFTVVCMGGFWKLIISFEKDNETSHWLKDFFPEEKHIFQLILLGIFFFVLQIINNYILYGNNTYMSILYHLDDYYRHSSLVFVINNLFSSLFSLLFFTLPLFSVLLSISHPVSALESIQISAKIVLKKFFTFLLTLALLSLICLDIPYGLRLIMKASHYFSHNAIEIVIGLYKSVTWSFTGCFIYAIYSDILSGELKMWEQKIETIGQIDNE